MTRRDLALGVAVLFSGGASLMYQVAWTRKVTTVTSASGIAAALVLGVFMAGLGLGAALGGRFAGRLRHPARGYAAVETAAGLIALVSFPLITASDGIRTVLYGLGVSLQAGLFLQLLTVSLGLLLPTTLLGASLPLLIEHTERHGGADARNRRGRIVATLYGVNTAGAVLGAYASGFWTIEHFGLTLTGAAGTVLAVIAAGLVLLTAQIPPEGTAGASTGPGPEPRFLLAAGLAGFAGLAAEVVWIRLFTLIVPTTVYAFSMVLIAVLLGIALGAALAGALSSRIRDGRRVARLAGAGAALAGVLMATIPLLVIHLSDSVELQKALASGRAPLGALLLTAVIPTAALVAAVLPLLTAASRMKRGAGAFGALYGVNTIGSILGATLTGFVFIPYLGLRAAGTLVALSAVGVGAVLFTRGTPWHERFLLLGGAAAACLLLYGAADVPRAIYERRLPDHIVVREFHEGRESHVMVTDDESSGLRRLWINSQWVAGIGGPHRAFGHLPALFIDAPRRALGIALGTGQTFAAAMSHHLESLDCVEIDSGVIDLSRRWFSEANDGLLDDPRVRVHVVDGRAFLRASETRYDLIVLEPLQAWSAGTSNLYSREFYDEASRALAPGGVLSQWIPFYGQGVEETRTMVATGLEVFPHGLLWLAHRDGVLLLSDAPFNLAPDVLQKRIDARDLLQDLEPFPAQSAADLFVNLLLSGDALTAWVSGAEILEDDRPFLEYRAAGQIGSGEKRFQEILESIEPFMEDFAAGEPALASARRVRDAAIRLHLLPRTAWEERAACLEAISVEDRGVPLWWVLYRQTILEWLASPEVQDADPGVAARIKTRALWEAEAVDRPKNRTP